MQKSLYILAALAGGSLLAGCAENQYPEQNVMLSPKQPVSTQGLANQYPVARFTTGCNSVYESKGANCRRAPDFIIERRETK